VSPPPAQIYLNTLFPSSFAALFGHYVIWPNGQTVFGHLAKFGKLAKDVRRFF
jgi:hypothetical protein